MCAATFVAAAVPAAARQPEVGTVPEGEAAAPLEALAGAQRELEALQGLLGEVLAAAHHARVDATAAQREVLSARESVASLEGVQAAAADRLATAQQQVDSMAAVAYVGGGRPDELRAVLAAQDPGDLAGRRVLIDAAGDQQADVLAELAEAKAAADADVDAAVAAQRTADGRLNRALEAVEVADADLVALQDRIADAAQHVLAARAALLHRGLAVGEGGVAATLPGVDLPLVALDAYQRAARYARSVFGVCELDWYEVAGISRVESNHGRYGGAQLLASGDIRPPIRGIALDGTRGTARIPDTDGGLLDGDPVWDRAVGPTQFIPATWRGYARQFDLDGNGDGVADPDNMYDAARATALYLCRNGGTMSTDAERSRAAFAYNRSQAYVASVLHWMRLYSSLAVPDLSGDPLAPAVPASPIAAPAAAPDPVPPAAGQGRPPALQPPPRSTPVAPSAPATTRAPTTTATATTTTTTAEEPDGAAPQGAGT